MRAEAGKRPASRSISVTVVISASVARENGVVRTSAVARTSVVGDGV
ncbi:Uncharacterised protein [Mycobacteroides abscessus subsp. abscessus]|nr:Uncharacterised protein [Mycobacteroides abscessus subsp. abscessus]